MSALQYCDNAYANVYLLGRFTCNGRRRRLHGWRFDSCSDSSLTPERPGHAPSDAPCWPPHPSHTQTPRTNMHFIMNSSGNVFVAKYLWLNRCGRVWVYQRLHQMYACTAKLLPTEGNSFLLFYHYWNGTTQKLTLKILLKSSLSTLRKWQLSSLRTMEAARGASLTRASFPKSSPSWSVHTTPWGARRTGHHRAPPPPDAAEILTFP